MRVAKLIMFFLFASLGSCAVKTPVRKTAIASPEAWASPTSSSLVGQTADIKEWWKIFHDAKLDALIAEATNANLDMKLAEARLREARALTGVAEAGLRPSIGAAGNAQRIRGGFPQGLKRVAVTPGASSEIGVFQAGFDASWELDMFGKLRAETQAAVADARAAEEMRRDVLISALAEVARNYIELRGFQKRLEIVRSVIAVQNETLTLTRIRAKAGLAPALDVARAETELAREESLTHGLEASILCNAHRISVLLGKNPGDLRDELLSPHFVSAKPSEIPIGLPSELLQRRPDLRRAEAEVAAALARLNAAKSERFPKFSLTGFVGRQGSSGGLSLGTGNFFAVGPSVSLPIFTAGRIRSAIHVRDAQAEQALIRYQSATLRAFEDVENALTAYAYECERREKLRAAVEAAGLTVELSRERYAHGLEDFLGTLDAQRTRLSNQDELAASETRTSVELIRIYKSLGGGW
jgi:NodT family efflux transporter outer membrane factor (OMF) lipoprotein